MHPASWDADGFRCAENVRVANEDDARVVLRFGTSRNGRHAAEPESAQVISEERIQARRAILQFRPHRAKSGVCVKTRRAPAEPSFTRSPCETTQPGGALQPGCIIFTGCVLTCGPRLLRDHSEDQGLLFTHCGLRASFRRTRSLFSRPRRPFRCGPAATRAAEDWSACPARNPASVRCRRSRA